MDPIRFTSAMTEMLEGIDRAATAAMDVVLNETQVDRLWMPDGAGEILQVTGFEAALDNMPGRQLAPDGRIAVPVAENVDRLRSWAGAEDAYVAVQATDTHGNPGIFPGRLLPSESGVLIGYLNAPPGYTASGRDHTGDKLPPDGRITDEQTTLLELMRFTEAQGTGAHDQADVVSLADLGHVGTAAGLDTTRTWQQDPHATTHRLSGEEGSRGEGLGKGLTQEADLYSGTRDVAQDTVLNPRVVFYLPGFRDAKVPDNIKAMIEKGQAAEVVLAVVYKGLGRIVGQGRQKETLASGIQTFKEALASTN